MTWRYVPPPGKDFVALNRASVQSGLTTAQEQQHYRATHDIRRKPRKREERGKLNLPDDMVFGISTRYAIHSPEIHAVQYPVLVLGWIKRESLTSDGYSVDCSHTNLAVSLNKINGRRTDRLL